VRAVTDLLLWITRRAFVAAVSAHEDVARLADATAREHLARPKLLNTASPSDSGLENNPGGG
jgi:hypothetical protein